MIKKHYSNQARLRRHLRVRKKVVGIVGRPRLCVFRSGNQIYAQIVDDTQGRTLVAASSRDTDLASITTKPTAAPAAKAPEGEAEGEENATPTAYRGLEENRRVLQAYKVGQLIAQRALAAGISRVVFDRGGYIYHGRVAALADGARKGGLDF